MTSARALLVPNPSARDVAVPVGVELDEDGRSPARLSDDGNDYRLIGGRGPEGEWRYELREE